MPVPATRYAPAVSAKEPFSVAPSAGLPTSALGTWKTIVPFGPALNEPLIECWPLVLSEPASNVPSLKVTAALPPWPVVVARAYHHVVPPGALAVPASCQYTVQIPDVMFGSWAVGGAVRRVDRDLEEVEQRAVAAVQVAVQPADADRPRVDHVVTRFGHVPGGTAVACLREVDVPLVVRVVVVPGRAAGRAVEDDV